MNSQVGVNRRIFDMGYAQDDINHTQYEQVTRKDYLVKDSTPLPTSLFEYEISDGRENLFTHRDVAYDLIQPNSLGKKPDYIKEKRNQLLEVGLYETAISEFPHNLKYFQQKQFELNEQQEPNPISNFVLNGQDYSVNKNSQFMK